MEDLARKYQDPKGSEEPEDGSSSVSVEGRAVWRDQPVEVIHGSLDRDSSLDGMPLPWSEDNAPLALTRASSSFLKYFFLILNGLLLGVMIAIFILK